MFVSICCICICSLQKVDWKQLHGRRPSKKPEKVNKIWFLDQKSGEHVEQLKLFQKAYKIYIGQDPSFITLPADMSALVNLKELNIYKTKIQQIPPSIHKLQKLEKLILHENNIGSLPGEIALLPNLKELSLASNQINFLPDNINDCVVLEELDLTNNPIANLPNSVTKISTLKILRLESTNIKEIPNDIGNLRNLEELRFQYNHNTTFPSSLTKLTKLKTLAINTDDQADWGELVVIIGKIVSLEHLNISSKTLKSFPKTFANLKNLEELDLTLTNLPPSVWEKATETLKAMTSLKIIRLPNFTPEITKELIQKILPKVSLQ